MLEVLNVRWHSSACGQEPSNLLARAVLRSYTPFNLNIYQCQDFDIDAYSSSIQSTEYILVDLLEVSSDDDPFTCWFSIKLDACGQVDMSNSGIADCEEVLLEYGLEHEFNLHEGA